MHNLNINNYKIKNEKILIKKFINTIIDELYEFSVKKKN